jgi:dCMP deaminase
MYIEWYPCCDCARAIIQSGVSTIFCSKPNFEDERWGEDFKITQVLFEESGVQVNYI